MSAPETHLPVPDAAATVQAAPVTETHWAAADRCRMADFTDALPAVLQSNFALWQIRVDRSQETPFVPHTRLFAVTACECAPEQLKAAGLKWASKKRAWHWHAPEDACRSFGKKDLDPIRAKYGTRGIGSRAFERLAA